MLTKEQNDQLTQTGPGTPCGALFRQYWLPVALCEEVPPGGAPVPLRILTEDLVLFRGEDGSLGLLGLLCPHRCADLSYGRIEDGGLRCLYHGWLFDKAGRCLDQPAEPENSTYKDEIRHTAYPVVEKAGVVFAYMGPGEPPPFPDYEFLRVPDEYRAIYKVQLECNFFQACEGDFDPSHVSYLHRRLTEQAVNGVIPGGDGRKDAGNYFVENTRPKLSYEKTDYGVRIFSARPLANGKKYLRVTNFLLPSLAVIAGRQEGGNGYTAVWRIPIDDVTHWRFGFQFEKRAPLDRTKYDEQTKKEFTDDYRLVRNQRNRYLQDRSSMSRDNFTGMGTQFMVHDAFAAETPGAIQDRRREHLATGDIIITGVRRLMREAIERVEKGERPPNVLAAGDDPQYPQLVVINTVLDEQIDNSAHVNSVIEHPPQPMPV
jgi:phenylpropionate dioxygenase-like ring-hydroxylating dioxygenase large terminal subunit